MTAINYLTAPLVELNVIAFHRILLLPWLMSVYFPISETDKKTERVVQWIVQHLVLGIYSVLSSKHHRPWRSEPGSQWVFFVLVFLIDAEWLPSSVALLCCWFFSLWCYLFNLWCFLELMFGVQCCHCYNRQGYMLPFF